MFTRAIVSAACLAVTVGAASVQHGAVARSMEAEASRIGNSLETFGDQGQSFAPGLGRVKEAVARDRLFFALDELQEPWTFEAAMRWANARDAIKTADQFSAEWKRVGAPGWGTPALRLPAAVEAIAASSASRGPATWRASLPYSQDAGMNAGLYYLGESQAYAAFAAYCRSLAFSSRGTRPAFKPMAAEITALESQVAEMYDKAPADVKPRFIRVSVGLKIAHTLDEHKDYGAALYQYLAAQYRAAVATAPDRPVADVKARLERHRATLPAGTDHSIAELFLERAAFLLESADPAAARSAAVIADTIVPAYLKLVQR